MKKRIIFAISLIGFSSMAGQIVLMRELLAVFYGNELALGVMLASWFFWTAAGSWIAGRKLTKAGTGVFAACQIALAFILPLSILAVKSISSALGFLPGEIVGILPMMFSTFVLLAPVCLLSGALFVSGCGAFTQGKEDAARIGRVYILEAAGAVAGGLAASFIFIRLLPGFHTLLFVAFLNMLSAFLLLKTKWALLPFLGFMLLFAYSNDLNSFFTRMQWKGQGLLSTENSIYGNVAVTKKEEQRSIFINGIHEFTVPDRLTAQMNAHLPLLEHPDPRRVLLIGGGSSSMLKEALKHPAERIDYVELDPLIIELSEKHMMAGESLKNPRVKVSSDIDGRLFVKTTRHKYDVVIVSLPGPHTAQLNRFYTRQFFVEVKDILKNRGVFSFKLVSNPNYISREQARLYKTLKNTLEGVFEDVVITPGEANFFLASSKKGAVTLDEELLLRRLRIRHIDAVYMRDYYLTTELASDRMESFAENLGQSDTQQINTDSRPIAYYYDLVLWNTFFRYNLKGLFKAATEKRIYMAAIVLFLLLLILGRGRGVLVCVGTTGFTEIAFQVITLVAFQAAYGYVYYKLGIIMTSFMAGLILGGIAITRKLNRDEIASSPSAPRNDTRLFLKTQVLICIYPLLLPLFFKAPFSSLLQILPIIPGFIGGYQFPLANKLYLKKSKARAAHSAGLTYGIDLLGSCLGALLVSIFLIPIIGLPASCILLAAMNLTALTRLLA